MKDREKLIELLNNVGSNILQFPTYGFIEHLAEYLLENGVTVQTWISVKERLPEPEQEVFVCVRSKISNYSYVCCAMYVPENWYRQSSDFCWDIECCDDYDEEQDDFIVKQGWYESIHNWDDYSVVGIEDIVTHWMPMPKPSESEGDGKA